MTANVLMFGILYSIGNLVAICSTAFLLGPMKQFKKMFDSTRIIATGIYLGTIVLTLLVALKMVFSCLIIEKLCFSYLMYRSTNASFALVFIIVHSIRAHSSKETIQRTLLSVEK